MLMTPEVASMHIMGYVGWENARRRAAKDGFYLISDPDFYAGEGIKTAGDWELYSLKAEYSDAHKEVCGFRPRVGFPPGTTAADVLAAIWAL